MEKINNSPNKKLNVPRIKMSFGIVNKSFLVNTHFVLGILLSAFVALGFTLAADIKGFFGIDYFSPNIQWFLSYMFIFFTIFVSSLRGTYTPEEAWLKLVKRCGIICFGVWLVSICLYGLLSPCLYKMDIVP